MRKEIFEKFLPLTFEEREELKNKKLKKHDIATIYLHWFNALVWFVELITGSALIISRYYRFTPEFWQKIWLEIFGSRANLLKFHIMVGVTWIVVLLIYAIFGYKNYLLGYIKNMLILTRDDIEWVIKRGQQILGKKVSLPPQGIYNGGQKLYAWDVAVGTLIIAITGLIMAFHLCGTTAVRWAIALHFLGVGMVVMGLFVHIYMAAFMPEERQSFFSMFTGYVNELYAYEHHYKWWQEMVREREKWLETYRKEIEEELKSTGEAKA